MVKVIIGIIHQEQEVVWCKYGTRGQCPLYVEYRWNAGVYTYNEAERVSASVPGKAGYKTSAFDTNIIIDTSLT